MNKYTKPALLAFFAAAMSLSSVAQSYSELANQFSMTGILGSSRTQAMGGAQVAVGGDPGALHINPAGIGVYRNSTFSISPSFQWNNTDATIFPGQNNSVSNSDFRPGIGLPNISVVFSETYDRENPNYLLRGQSFGISYNQMYSFRNKTQYTGTLRDNNIRDYYIEGLEADNVGTGYFYDESGLAIESTIEDFMWHSGAISSYRDSNGNYTGEYFTPDAPGAEGYYTPSSPGGADTYVTETIKTSGGMNELAFSYGGNYDDIFMFGFNLGIPILRYRQEKVYFEDVDNQQQYNLDYVELREDLRVNGTGFNASAGVIVRPSDFIRFGASIKTPSFLWLSETYDASLSVRHQNQYIPLENGIDSLGITSYDASIARIESEYNMVTPMRANGGVALFIGKHGFITGDVEYVPYSTAKITSEDFSTSNDNQAIRSAYQDALNFRLGAEYRHEALRLRAGYAHNGSTLANDNLDNSNNFITAGFGVKNRNNAFDVAVIHSTYTTSYVPYTLASGNEPTVDIDNNRTQIMFTYSTTF